MNVSQAVAALVSLASMIFLKTSNESLDREENSSALRQVVESTLHSRSIALETKTKDTLRIARKCKVYVFPASRVSSMTRSRVLYAATSDNMKHAQAFRTYPSRGASLNPTIVEAVCTTMPIPSHFMPETTVYPTMQSDVYALGCLGLEVSGASCRTGPLKHRVYLSGSYTFKNLIPIA
jgi:hypothetical protein